MAGPVDAAPRAVVLDAGCAALRRRLGALPWVALEVLTERATDVDGKQVATISVRGLASELGIAKDTATRAVAVLRAEGLIAPDQRRDGGRFGKATYVVAASIAVRVVAPESARRVRVAAGSQAGSGASAGPGSGLGQLALFSGV